MRVVFFFILSLVFSDQVFALKIEFWENETKLLGTRQYSFHSSSVTLRSATLRALKDLSLSFETYPFGSYLTSVNGNPIEPIRRQKMCSLDRDHLRLWCVRVNGEEPTGSLSETLLQANDSVVWYQGWVYFPKGKEQDLALWSGCTPIR